MTHIFINEIHYENVLFDVGEGVEVAGPAGTSLDGWSLQFYKGSDGKQYKEKKLSGLIPNLQSGFGTIFFRVKDIQRSDKGAGIALVNASGQVEQFLSYEGSDGFVAADGAAKGKKSEKIPVKETSSTATGKSLQLVGEGNKYRDFKWTGPAKASYGSINKGQKFLPLVSGGSNNNTPSPSPNTGSTVIDTLTARNRKDHHTDKYHTKEMLIVRRGLPMHLLVVAKGSASDLSVIIEDYPDGKSKSVLKVQNTATSPDKWEAYVDSQDGKKVTVGINIPSNAFVGQYKLSVQDGSTVSAVTEPFIVLFNAWCEKDDVYMEKEAHREEYVLNDEGFIWVGSAFNNTGRPWNFGQFNTKSLLCSLLLLESLPQKDRGNAVAVARHISAMVNVQDDKGVLVGNWSGNYPDGNSPTSWTGSAEIMKNYYLTREPVKYGQCWVFSGVVTAVMRSLGLPTRSVTNFASAHDTTQPFNRAVDKYFKKNLEEDEARTSDSIWNFHVWNDVWFKRPDLKNKRYDGWQAIDATPQERSQGKFQTGPAPLIAIKNGEKNINYDLEFIYSEVNADVKHWVENDSGKYDLVKTITDAVGFNISTKAVGSSRRHDVTLEYKYPEGSSMERASISGNAVTTEDTKESVRVDLEVSDKIVLGQPVVARVHIQRKPGVSSNLTANVTFGAFATSYSSRVSAKQVKLVSGKVSVPSDTNQSGSETLNISQQEYLPFIKSGDVFITFRASVTIVENNQSTVLTKDFRFVDPPIEIDLLVPTSALRVGGKGKVAVSFANPLSVPLTKTVLKVEGQSLTKAQTFDIGSVAVKKSFTQEVELEFFETGKHILIVHIDSAEVGGVDGYLEVYVN